MPQDHRLPPQRFELKYLVPEELVGAIRDFLGCYLELDDYSARQPARAYEIHSVYLDSADLHTYRVTVNGDKNRFKLRLRYYEGGVDAPVFAEIKQRVDNCILKRRCPLRRDAVPILLAGQLPGPDQMLTREARHAAALERFNELQLRLAARPCLHNNYSREAWVSPHDNSVRVTLDRQIRIEPYFGDQPVMTMTRPARIYPNVVVVELKFTARFPTWFTELVQRFNFMRATASKYCAGVALLGEHRFCGARSAGGDSALGTPGEAPFDAGRKIAEPAGIATCTVPQAPASPRKPQTKTTLSRP